MQNTIDSKVNRLLSLSNEFLFPEYYSHTNQMMWKIKNIFTEYNEEKIVLCCVEEGFEKALDEAILVIEMKKKNFFGES